MRITDTVFQDYLTCKLKAFLTLKGEPGTPCEYMAVLADVQREYRPLATAALLKKLYLAPGAVERASIETGSPLILDCRIVHEPCEFRFDALRRVKGKSRLGDFHYEPILFVKETNVSEDRKRLLAFGGFVLGEAQGVQPSRGGVVYGKECSFTNVQLGAGWTGRTTQLPIFCKCRPKGHNPCCPSLDTATYASSEIAARARP